MDAESHEIVIYSIVSGFGTPSAARQVPAASGDRVNHQH
jgi:hypothetical protein